MRLSWIDTTYSTGTPFVHPSSFLWGFLFMAWNVIMGDTVAGMTTYGVYLFLSAVVSYAVHRSILIHNRRASDA